MYRVFEALDELGAIVEEARGVPMTAGCVVPRGDVLELIDDIKDAIPGELDDAQDVLDARDSLLREAKEQLSKLEGMDVASDEFLEELTLFRADVIKHAEREETEEFSRLQRKLSAEDLGRMAKAVQAAEAIAPTRPHPGVESPVLNYVVGPFASMLDRARDALASAMR